MAAPLSRAPLAPLTVPTALRAWEFAPVVSALLAVLAAAYLAGVCRVAARHPARPWPTWRAGAFLAGLAVIGAATQSSIGVYDDVLFTEHMVQHLLLIMVVPPLLILGRPVTLLLHAAGNPVHTWVKRAVRSAPVSALTWPPVAIVCYCTVIVVTHLTPLMNLALENDAVHNAEHVLYLVTGYLFFLPILGSEPIRWRPSLPGRFLMLLIVMPVDTATGVILRTVPRELFPAYAHTGRTWGPSLLADLHAGGTIMWVGSDLLMSLLAAGLAVLLIHGTGRAGQRGRCADQARRTALLRSLSGAGVSLPGRGSIDDDAHLAAYNAYLSRLGHPAIPAADGTDVTGAEF